MLYNIFLLMLITGVLLFIVSLIFVFVFKIPDLVDEMSGNRARRQIKRLKELNSGTSNLDSMDTNEVYKSLSTVPLKIDESIEVDEDEDIIKEVSREIDTGGLSSGESQEVSKDWNEEPETGYMAEKLSGQESIDEEQATGYMSGLPVSESEEKDEQSTGYIGGQDIATGYVPVEELPTGYIEEFEEATGFMQTAPDEEEATGVLLDLRDFVASKQCVEILEEQTSLDLSAVL